MNYFIDNDFKTFTLSSVNIIECIKIFDAGYDRIYINNEDGTFAKLALVKENLHYLPEGSEGWILSVEDDEIIYDINNEESLNEKVLKHTEKSTLTMPVICDGKIKSIIKFKEKRYEILNWGVFHILSTLDYLSSFEEVIISSLNNRNAREFYRRFNPYIPITILDENNIKRIYDDNVLLIYCSEVFTDRVKNKISINEMNKKNIDMYKKRVEDIIVIDKTWESLKEEECNVVACIKKFDKGVDNIYIVNDKNEFQYTVSRHMFRDDMLQPEFRKYYEIYIEDDESELMARLAASLSGTPRKECPILRDNLIIANGRKNENDKVNIKINWDYISLNKIAEVLGEYKILISSYYGELKQFYDRYSSVLNVDIMDEEKLKLYFLGEYDYVFFNTDVWMNIGKAKCIDIKQIYLDFLGDYVVEYLKERGVSYYYFKTPRSPGMIYNYNERHEKYTTNIVRRAKVSVRNLFRKKREDDNYYVNCDFVVDGVEVKDGCRRTAFMDNDMIYQNKIHCFGTSAAIGYNVDDGKTWISCIQEKLIRQGINYCIQFVGGVIGAYLENEIGTLYNILDIDIKKGDIIIQMGPFLHNSELINAENYFDWLEWINDKACRNSKWFIDWPGHLGETGNKALAGWVYSKIEKDIKK